MHRLHRPFTWLPVLLLLAQGCAAAQTLTRATKSPSTDPLDVLSPSELFEHGARFQRAGDIVRAEQYLSAAIAHGHPQSAAVPRLLELCLRASRLHAALSYGVPYLQERPNDIQLRLLLAAVRLGLAQFKEAHTELTEVLGQQPNHAAARYLRATIARDHVGDPRAAARDFVVYLKVAPNGPHALEAKAFLNSAFRKRPTVRLKRRTS